MVDATLFGVLNDARARRRRRRIRITAVVAVAAVTTVALGLLVGRGTPASRTGPSKTAPLLVVGCASKTTTTGTPSGSLLAILGVLRRPATPVDALPVRLTRNPLGGAQIFINYVRRARVVTGGTYYIYPLRATTCGRADTRGDSVALTDVTHCGASGASETFGGATASQLESGDMLAYGGGCSRSLDTSLVTGVLPDGVATVALHYRAGRVGGYSRKLAPAATITTTVVDNVIVFTVPRGGGNGHSWSTMTWRAANGHVIKTFTRS